MTIMRSLAQLTLQGTNFVNFVGMHSWVGLQSGFEAVRVTEWDEPQAVIGSYLQRFAYPDYYRAHVERNHRELINWTRGQTFDRHLSGETHPLEHFANIVQGTPDRVGCLQNRGEYMFVAQGSGGFMVYDVASIANKAFPSISSPRLSRRCSAAAPTWPRATRPAWRSPPTSRSPPPATTIWPA